jgi:hypothetical protein
MARTRIPKNPVDYLQDVISGRLKDADLIRGNMFHADVRLRFDEVDRKMIFQCSDYAAMKAVAETLLPKYTADVPDAAEQRAKLNSEAIENLRTHMSKLSPEARKGFMQGLACAYTQVASADLTGTNKLIDKALDLIYHCKEIANEEDRAMAVEEISI